MITFDTLFNILPENIRVQAEHCAQNPVYHPEIWLKNHIQTVFDNIYKLYGEDTDLLVAAIFHDLGKLDCTVVKVVNGNEKISSINHETASLKYIDEYFDKYSEYTQNKEKIIDIVKNHMRAHLYINGVMKNKGKRLRFEELKYFSDIIRFSKCDGDKL